MRKKLNTISRTFTRLIEGKTNVQVLTAVYIAEKVTGELEGRSGAIIQTLEEKIKIK